MMRVRLLILTLVLIILPLSAEPLFAGDSYNGFDISKSLIPKEEILQGGPPRDGIPAILKPKFEAAEKAKWLRDNGLVSRHV